MKLEELRAITLSEIQRPSTQMLAVLQNSHSHLYAGTVPAAVKAKRRAQNRVARKSRRRQK